MLSAIGFYLFLFFALVIVPATMILAVLLLLDRERLAWRRGLLTLSRIGSRAARWLIALGLEKRFPRSTELMGRRFDPGTPWGLHATVAGLFILLGLWFFLSVLQDIVAKDPLVILDLRLHNAVPLFRTPATTWIMLTLTTLGSAAILSLVCMGAALHALARQRPRIAAIFVGGLAGTGLLSVTLKALAARARPLDSLIGSHEASFPSGHLLSGAVVYGLVAFLLLASGARPAGRALGVTLLLMLIVGIGISRLYVGVHWPSDLLASLALALIVLASLLFALHFGHPIRGVDTFRLPLAPATLRLLGNGAFSIALGATAVMTGQVEMIPFTRPAASQPLDSQTWRSTLPKGLPLWSEDLVGNRMEPLSLAIIGSEADLLSAFVRAGWTRAEPPTPLRVVREGVAALRNLPDPSAPATPAFFADRPQDLTLEKPDAGLAFIRRRHHVRLWQTSYCMPPQCRPLWVATASYDVGVQLSPRIHLPTHVIDPAVDDERARVVTDLVGSGATQAGIFAVVAPIQGKNASGDPFVTDGRAVLLVLR